MACATIVAGSAAEAATGSPKPAGQNTNLQVPTPQAVPDSYIVVFKDTVTYPKAAAKDMALRHGLSLDHVYAHALKGFAATIPVRALERVRDDPRVEFISPNLVLQAVGTVPNVPRDSAPTGVRRVAAATATTAHQGSTVAVAVIDTGVDLTHPDLNAVNGKDCTSKRKYSLAQDDNGHGSHVAGTIGARNNGSGVVGVAPDTLIYAVKVLNSSGSGTWAQAICGVDWVTQHASSLNIKVANMSLGGFGSLNDNNCGNTNGDAMHKAICNSTAAGVTYVVSAGNSSVDFGNDSGSSYLPAAYPEVLTVTAMADSDGAPGGTGGDTICDIANADDRYSDFSNFAVATTEINHTIAGPGVCITSTVPTGNCAYCDSSGYKTISGTSMAAPHLTGTVALCIGNGATPGACAGLTPSQIVEKLRGDAATYSNANSGYGFNGDPNHCSTFSGHGKTVQCSQTAYYGYLAWDGAY